MQKKKQTDNPQQETKPTTPAQLHHNKYLVTLDTFKFAHEKSNNNTTPMVDIQLILDCLEINMSESENRKSNKQTRQKEQQTSNFVIIKTALLLHNITKKEILTATSILDMNPNNICINKHQWNSKLVRHVIIKISNILVTILNTGTITIRVKLYKYQMIKGTTLIKKQDNIPIGAKHKRKFSERQIFSTQKKNLTKNTTSCLQGNINTDTFNNTTKNINKPDATIDTTQNTISSFMSQIQLLLNNFAQSQNIEGEFKFVQYS